MNTALSVNTPSPTSLFSQTEATLKFWVGVVENLSKKAIKEYLASMGWDSRSASPYLRLARFIKEYFPQEIERLSRLDIQTLLRLPTKRYSPLIDSLQGKDSIDQVALKGLVKTLPTAPKKPQQNKKIEVDINILEQLTQATGLTAKEAIEYACREVASRKSEVGSEEAATCDLRPETCDLPSIPVRFQEGENVYAFLLKEVRDDDMAVYGDRLIPTSQLKPIDIELIRAQINDHKKIGFPYHQAFINAAQYKQACTEADNAIEEGSRTKYENQAKNCLIKASRIMSEHGIWFDLAELETNRRLVFIPGGEEDFIAQSGNSPRQPIEKKQEQLKSILEGFRNERPQTALSECLEDAVCWEHVSTIVRKSNKTLTEAVRGWSEAQKHGLVEMLANHIVESPQVILNGSLDWLNSFSFQKALKQIIFSVRGTKYRLQEIMDYKTDDELWFMIEMNASMPEPRFFSRQELRVEGLIGF